MGAWIHTWPTTMDAMPEVHPATKLWRVGMIWSLFLLSCNSSSNAENSSIKIRCRPSWIVYNFHPSVSLTSSRLWDGVVKKKRGTPPLGKRWYYSSLVWIGWRGTQKMASSSVFASSPFLWATWSFFPQEKPTGTEGKGSNDRLITNGTKRPKKQKSKKQKRKNSITSRHHSSCVWLSDWFCWI